jgi:HlyD family secretion protein
MNSDPALFIEEITDSKEVMQATAPPLVKWFLIILFTVVVFVVLFLFLFQRDVSISSQGIIEPSQSIETVVLTAGGKVVVNNVTNGSYVSTGDVLLKFDVGYAEQQLELLEVQLRDAEDRMVSIKLLKSSYEQDSNLLSPDNIYYFKFIEYESEKAIVAENSRLEVVESQQSQLATDNLIVLYQDRIDTLNWKMEELSRLQYAIVDSQQFNSADTYIQSTYNSFIIEFNSCKQALDDATSRYLEAQQKFANGSISQTELDAEKAFLDTTRLQFDTVVTSYSGKVEAELEASRAQKASYEDQVAQLRAQNSNVYSTILLPMTLDQLKVQKILEAESLQDTIQKEIEACQIQILDLEAQVEDSIITASTDGVVMLENEIIVGEIVQPGITFLYIVPDNEMYRVTLYVLDADIAKVKNGATALLSVDAYPYQEYGRLECVIDYVSVTSVSIENIGQVYRVEGTLPEIALTKKDGTHGEVLAGMTVDADIVYDTEPWITWLLREINLSN